MNRQRTPNQQHKREKKGSGAKKKRGQKKTMRHWWPDSRHCHQQNSQYNFIVIYYMTEFSFPIFVCVNEVGRLRALCVRELTHSQNKKYTIHGAPMWAVHLSANFFATLTTQSTGHFNFRFVYALEELQKKKKDDDSKGTFWPVGQHALARANIFLSPTNVYIYL